MGLETPAPAKPETGKDVPEEDPPATYNDDDGLKFVNRGLRTRTTMRGQLSTSLHKPFSYYTPRIHRSIR